MRLRPTRTWALAVVPLAAALFILWTDALRTHRVDYVSGLPGWSTGQAPLRKPRLIVPEHDNDAYAWLSQTRQMLDRGDWRLRRVDYENAPFGRPELGPSPYRWWLGWVAAVEHAATGRPAQASLEQAALVSDPLLHLGLLALVTLWVGVQFGAVPAALGALCVAALYPFAAGFLPGAPSARGLAQIAALASVFPLLGALRAVQTAGRRPGTGFALAALAGALGLWLSPTVEFPVIVGTALGGIAAAGLAGRESLPATARLWRLWSLVGAGASLLAYGAEYFPSALGSWQLRVNHPLYGIAWLGLGEAVALAALARSGTSLRGWRPALRLLGVLAALAALPVTLKLTHELGFLAADPSDSHLARLPDAPVATSLSAWASKSEIGGLLGITLLPLLIPAAALTFLTPRRATPTLRSLTALSLGPLLVALGFAFKHLAAWGLVDILTIPVLVALWAGASGPDGRRPVRWAVAGLAAAVLLPGVFVLIPPAYAFERKALGEVEVIGLIERDLAGWLEARVDSSGGTVLAPPNATATLHYYGGLRGVSSLAWENKDGLGAAIRIASASTDDEARELIGLRSITHLVIPSWDPYMDIYAQMGLGQVEGSFIGRLHQWQIPSWLRPMAYPLPGIAGFEGQSITVFEVVDDQDASTAAARLAEYFIEMGRLDLAAKQALVLRRYPGDMGALVARAQVAVASDDSEGFQATVAQAAQRLASGAPRLAWDRRVALAIVLAQARRTDLARVQLNRCLEELDASKLKLLGPLALYRFQVLCRVVGAGISDPDLRNLALELLPPDYRARLEP